MFTKSLVQSYHHKDGWVRWGQGFYNHMLLHKVVDPADKAFCDSLYNIQDDNLAKAMVAERTDQTQ